MNLDEIRLENERVLLEPLASTHLALLLPVALQPGLTRYSPSKIDSEAALAAYLERALDLREEGKAVPFAVIDKKSQSAAGCTRYMNIDWDNKVLHIGATWIGREFHGSGLNTEIKGLMIDFAFDELGFEKVEFRIDERNIRSRKAVEKLGARLEGVLRRDVYLADGFKRNTCCYGLLPEEWKPKRNTL